MTVEAAMALTNRLLVQAQALEAEDAAALLVAAGYENVTEVPRSWQAPLRFVAAQ
jgi:hypothetical protein